MYWCVYNSEIDIYDKLWFYLNWFRNLIVFNIDVGWYIRWSLSKYFNLDGVNWCLIVF